MVFERLSAIRTGLFCLFNNGLKISILCIVQDFGQLPCHPKLGSARIRLLKSLESLMVVFIDFFAHRSSFLLKVNQALFVMSPIISPVAFSSVIRKRVGMGGGFFR